MNETNAEEKPFPGDGKVQEENTSTEEKAMLVPGHEPIQQNEDMAALCASAVKIQTDTLRRFLVFKIKRRLS